MIKLSILSLVVAAACGHPQHSGGGGGGGATGGGAGPVPPEIRKAVDQALGADAHIKVEHEHGATIYEARSQTKLELELTEAGQIQKTEVTIPLATLPSIVATAATANGGTISEAEVVVTPSGIAFEVEVKLGAGEVEYTIDQTGKILGEEREGENDKDDKD